MRYFNNYNNYNNDDNEYEYDYTDRAFLLSEFQEKLNAPSLLSEIEEVPDFSHEELKLYNEALPIENDFKDIPVEELTTAEMIIFLTNPYFLEKYGYRLQRFDEEYAKKNQQFIENIKNKIIKRETEKTLQYARNDEESNSILKWAIEKLKPEIDKVFENAQNRPINEAISVLEESGFLTEGEIKRFALLKSFIDIEIPEFLSEPTFVGKVESIVFEKEERKEKITTVARSIKNVHIYDVQKYILALTDMIAENYKKMLNPQTNDRVRDDIEKEQLKLIEKLERVITKYPRDTFYIKIHETRRFVETNKYLVRYLSTKVLQGIKEITKVDIGRPISQTTFLLNQKEVKNLTDILEKDEDGEILYQMFTGEPVYTLEKFLKMQKITLLSQ